MAIGEPTPKQLASEAVRQADSILITTGQFPNMDQTAAVLGLHLILKKLAKNSVAVISDSLPKACEFLPTAEILKDIPGSKPQPKKPPASTPATASVGPADYTISVDLADTKDVSFRYDMQGDKLNIYLGIGEGSLDRDKLDFQVQARGKSPEPTPEQAPVSGGTSFDLIILLGAPTRARVDKILARPELAEVPIVAIDFHRSNENFAAINLIEPYSASLCEILVSLAESLQQGLIDAEIATVLLAGIISATDRFTATHTTSKALTVAAQMMAAGGKQQEVVKHLFRGTHRSPDKKTPPPSKSKQ